VEAGEDGPTKQAQPPIGRHRSVILERHRNNGTRAKVWLPQTEGQTAALTQDISANTLVLKDES
jgi:hypothetical protein